MNIHIEQNNMIKQQLRTGDVLNEQILALYDIIPRHEFVPSHLKHFAYCDMQIELPHGQRMMTPLEEGLLLQSLNLTGQETILEIGTGTGYLTALLSQLSKKVISVDCFSDFTAEAKQRIIQHECNNVELHTGDASLGWLEKAPYDVIIFSGALEEINESHRLQVTPGGKLFAIVGTAPIMQGRLYQLNHQNAWSVELVFETCLPTLINNSKTDTFIF